MDTSVWLVGGIPPVLLILLVALLSRRRREQALIEHMADHPNVSLSRAEMGPDSARQQRLIDRLQHAGVLQRTHTGQYSFDGEAWTRYRRQRRHRVLVVSIALVLGLILAGWVRSAVPGEWLPEWRLPLAPGTLTTAYCEPY